MVLLIIIIIQPVNGENKFLSQPSKNQYYSYNDSTYPIYYNLQTDTIVDKSRSTAFLSWIQPENGPCSFSTPPSEIRTGNFDHSNTKFFGDLKIFNLLGYWIGGSADANHLTPKYGVPPYRSYDTGEVNNAGEFAYYCFTVQLTFGFTDGSLQADKLLVKVYKGEVPAGSAGMDNESVLSSSLTYLSLSFIFMIMITFRRLKL